MTKPTIVCLCGSTRFKSAYEAANFTETMNGKIVLSVGHMMHSSDIIISVEQKIMLDELHKRKIDLCDEVLVLNVSRYIGESTRSEINYATEHGKQIRYLEAE